jgi:ribose 5-phosphate isomerase A
MTPKQRAAEAAMTYVQSGMTVGLGTGSTADFFLQSLARDIKSGKLTGIQGVPTSVQSEKRARELGIPITDPARPPRADVTIDGADEVDPNFDLIKGLGGALLREKIVAQNSKKLVIIADAGKVVPQLGTRAMLPVEVVQFAHEIQIDFLKELGAEPSLRKTKDGKIFVTDNGNYIYDCRFPKGISNPAKIEQTLKARAGVVETGLFLKMATFAIIADDEHAEVCEPEN